MIARTKTQSVKAPLVTALTVLVMLLATGPVSAFYPPNGAMPSGVPADPYMNPDDGMCVIGVAANGDMRVDWSITNARDCLAYTKSADGTTVDLAGMTATDVTATSTCGAAGTAACGGSSVGPPPVLGANCTRPNGSVVWNAFTSQCLDVSKCVFAGSAPNDGYKHAWSNSICYDTANNQGLSRVDLDNTNAMCVSKGGTVVYTGKCVAYGWVYRNREAGAPPQTLPISGTGIATTDGVQLADNLGFCYTPVKMTGGTYTTPASITATSCPSYHNTLTFATNPTEWPACNSSTTGCQTQAAYDAGLGWSAASGTFSSDKCSNTFGLTGFLNANVTNVAGTVTPAGTAVDLTSITNQGDCLAAGYLWDNWLVSAGTTTKTNADGGNYAGMPAGTVIRKLDALTPVEGGGGEFFSGTGFNCLKCHADQSRAYQERDKPGFVKTRHQKAGDNAAKPFWGYFNGVNSSWGLDGVQCAMCHSTAKPARDDLIQVVASGITGPPLAGNPKSATGHNQTEYGAHILDICYTCHGDYPADPTTQNPAWVIPVSGTDFALTSNVPLPGPALQVSNLFRNADCSGLYQPNSCCTGVGTGTCQPNTGGLAPILNQFLNSPHAQYGGLGAANYPITNPGLKISVGNKDNYGSGFKGYVCRTAGSTIPGSSYGTTGATCPAGSFAGQPPGTTSNGCYFTSATCTSPNSWNSTFDPVQYPFATSPSIAGVCSGIGLGSIITTYYRNGVAEKIPNVDTVTNPACTNPGDGSPTSGAGGFWVKDGELSTGGTPSDTAQGNCMTCHDVHWALADTNPEAEAFRRECTTCHSHAGASASGAPRIDLANIAHVTGPGTPLENWLTEPDEACETCHMPKSSGTGSRMHLWRINPDPTYKTMGTTQANLAPVPDGTYDNAAWVDIDHACGQCHGGDSGTANPPAPQLTTADLAAFAVGMHNLTGAVTYPTTFDIATNALNVTVTAIVDCSGPCPALTYDWNWGDGNNASCTAPGLPFACCTAPGSGTCDSSFLTPSASHTYPIGGTKSITLTVKSDGGTKRVGSATRSFRITAPSVPVSFAGPSAACTGPGAPLACCTGSGTGTCTYNDACTAAGVPWACCTGSGAGTCSANPTCTWNGDTWTMRVDASASGGTAPLTIAIRWGDTSSATVIPAPAGVPVSASHLYLSSSGPYTVTATAIDAKLQSVEAQCAVPATPTRYQITGTVRKVGPNTPVANALVRLRRGTTLVKSVYTAADGTFTLMGLRPAAYMLKVSKAGFTFPAAQAVGVGPDNALGDIFGTKP